VPGISRIELVTGPVNEIESVHLKDRRDLRKLLPVPAVAVPELREKALFPPV
jgi:hypothetical protein